MYSSVDSQDHAQDSFCTETDLFFCDKAFLISFFYTVRISGCHLDIISGFCLTVVFSEGPPVCGNQSVKSPFVTENACQEFFMFGSMDAIEQVIRGHDGVWVCLFYNDLKLFQIDFTECSLGYSGVGILTVCLFVIRSKCEAFCSE